MLKTGWRVACTASLLCALVISTMTRSAIAQSSAQPKAQPAAQRAATPAAQPAAPPAGKPAAPPAAVDSVDKPPLKPEELEAMLAPIALYPDSLLTQML